jgi:outer membrane protein
VIICNRLLPPEESFDKLGYMNYFSTTVQLGKQSKQFRCYLLVITMLLAFSGWSEQRDTDCFATYCLKDGELSISLALGYGQRSNPLYLSDDRDLIALPDIAWYGEKAYLDNTELGYQWRQQTDFALETFVTLNTTNRYFQDDHISQFVLDGSELSASEIPALEALPEQLDVRGDEQSRARLSVADVSDRDFAVDLGVRAHWYPTNTSEWTVAVMQDISNVYQGARATMQYRHSWQWQKWKLVTAASLQWQSANLLDYYYGIDTQDTENPDLFYQANSGWQTTLSASITRTITGKWAGLIHISYSDLPESMTDSPLVTEKYTTTTFAGVTYRF